MSDAVLERARFLMFRQAVSDVLLAIPVAVISFLTGDTRIASRYTAIHFVAIVAYIVTGVWGLQSGNNTAQNIMRAGATFMAHCVAWADFIFAYVLGCRIVYCGDASRKSPSFYSAFVLSGSDNYCDAYHTSGAIYTIVLAFVMAYCALSSAAFGLQTIATGGEISKTAKIGTLIYTITVIKIYQCVWFWFEWKLYSAKLLVVTGATTFIMGMVVLSVIFHTRIKSAPTPPWLNGVMWAILASEVVTICFSIIIWATNGLPTQMESILPMLVFFPSAIYICIAWYASHDKVLPNQRRSVTALGTPVKSGDLFGDNKQILIRI